MHQSPNNNYPDAAPQKRLRLLTIGGSDSGGGAGIQADLKTFAAHGAYGMSAITALTAQNTCEVRAVHEVSPQLVGAQIDAVLQDIGVDAIKIGMLSSAAIVHVVAERLNAYIFAKSSSARRSIPIVLDPVMVSKSGSSLLTPDAVEVIATELLPLATVVTPNLPELERLTRLSVVDEDERCRASEVLSLHGPAVLAKGGHAAVIRQTVPRLEVNVEAEMESIVVDLLLASKKWYRFTHPRLASRSTHGTGCTLSSAIAVHLAAGQELPTAVGNSLAYLHGAIAQAYPLGRCWGPVDHLYLTNR